jgi:hypothetical protein
MRDARAGRGRPVRVGIDGVGGRPLILARGDAQAVDVAVNDRLRTAELLVEQYAGLYELVEGCVLP